MQVSLISWQQAQQAFYNISAYTACYLLDVRLSKGSCFEPLSHIVCYDDAVRLRLDSASRSSPRPTCWPPMRGRCSSRQAPCHPPCLLAWLDLHILACCLRLLGCLHCPFQPVLHVFVEQQLIGIQIVLWQGHHVGIDSVYSLYMPVKFTQYA